MEQQFFNLAAQCRIDRNGFGDIALAGHAPAPHVVGGDGFGARHGLDGFDHHARAQGLFHFFGLHES